MKEKTLPERLQDGLALHRQGNLAGAQAEYGQILALSPEHPDALHLSGLIAHQSGQHDVAEYLIRLALAQQPDSVVYLNNLGGALRSLGRLDEAGDCYRQALSLQPGFADAWNNLVETLLRQGQVAAALQACRSACAANPASASLHNRLGVTLLEGGCRAEAEVFLRDACMLDPALLEAQVNLGFLARQSGRVAEARKILARAVQIAPASPAARLNLGLTCMDAGQRDDALEHYRYGLVAAPEHAGLLNAAGVALQASLQPEAAETSYRKSIMADPTDVEARNNLATLLLEQGRQAEAVSEWDRVLAKRPDYLNAQSNRLMALSYLVEDPQLLAAAHAIYGQLFPAACKRPVTARHARHDLLKIGFVSGDLCEHPVQYFLEPLLENLDRSRCKLFAYAAGPTEDDTTARLKAQFDGWRSIFRIADEVVAEWIENDGIDVLIDLSVHSALNRLPLFALGPAPVQLSWLGYPGQTGLESMDGLLVDGILAPHGELAVGHEALIRLPVYRPYRPPLDAPPVTASPYRRTGHLTFASLNGFAKVTPAMLSLWADILAAAPDARMIFAAAPGAGRRAEVESLFAQRGIARERLEWIGRLSLRDYLELHGRIDVALDTYPFNGGTTSFHSIWMGVPVLSWCGATLASRAGASLLLPLGLSDWVVDKREDYLRLALKFVAAPSCLDELRAGLRQRFANSAHGDAAGFARAFLSVCHNLAR
ncbi:MAG: tetratricopeptide repeat protein [Sterolibacterium sp.]